MRKKITLSCLAVLLIIGLSQAQVPTLNPNNAVLPAIANAAGGTYDIPTSYFRFEWSFGELLLIQSMAPADSSVLLTHGVLQPCTDQIGYSPFSVLFTQDEYRLFPNPTAGKFELDFFVRTPGQMSLQLINSLGQILSSKTYHYDGCCRIELFDISKYPNGIYYVVADLKPDIKGPGENRDMFRHRGFKVIKLSDKY